MTLIALSSAEWISVISILLGGTFISALVQVYRAKPDRDSVVVSASKNAAEIFKGLNDALYAELERTRTERDSERRNVVRYETYIEVLEKVLRDREIDIPTDRRPEEWAS